MTSLLLARLARLVGATPGLGHAARFFAQRYREGSETTIWTGHAAGLRWVRSRRFVNGYWTGQYELDVQGVITRSLRPGAVFWDIGANAGFFSLVGARAVGPTGDVLAIEPDPTNAAFAARQFAVNGLAFCTVLELALADREGEAAFERSANPSTGHLEAPGRGGRRERRSA